MRFLPSPHYSSSPRVVLFLALTNSIVPSKFGIQIPVVDALCVGSGCDILSATFSTFLLIGVAACCLCCQIPVIIGFRRENNITHNNTANSNSNNATNKQQACIPNLFLIMAIALALLSTLVLVRTILALELGGGRWDLWWLVAWDAAISVCSLSLIVWWGVALARKKRPDEQPSTQVEKVHDEERPTTLDWKFMMENGMHFLLRFSYENWNYNW